MLSDDNGELRISNGDFVCDDSARQHQKDLILSHPGSFTQAPQVGVGIYRMLLDDSSPVEVRSKISEQVELDGQSIDRLVVNTDYSVDMEASFL
jgi:hypothetical protein